MDLVIKEFELQLIDLINSSDLPLEVKRLAVYEVYDNLAKAAANEISRQARQQKEQATTTEE